jgi:hypothetical protein
MGVNFIRAKMGAGITTNLSGTYAAGTYTLTPNILNSATVYVTGDDNYALARQGTGIGVKGVFFSSVVFVGQLFTANVDGDSYEIDNMLLEFDVTGIPAGSQPINTAVLKLWLAGDNSTTDFVMEAYNLDYGDSITTADYVGATSFISTATKVASLSTSGIGAVGSLKTFADSSASSTKNGVVAVSTTTGKPRYYIVSSNWISNITPTGTETMTMTLANCQLVVNVV